MLSFKTTYKSKFSRLGWTAKYKSRW